MRIVSWHLNQTNTVERGPTRVVYYTGWAPTRLGHFGEDNIWCTGYLNHILRILVNNQPDALFRVLIY